MTNVDFKLAIQYFVSILAYLLTTVGTLVPETFAKLHS